MTALLLRPELGEDFVGYLSRQAMHMRLPLWPFRDWLELPHSKSARWPSTEALKTASRRLQIPFNEVIDMTVHRYPPPIVDFSADKRLYRFQTSWMMNPGGRTCRSCLLERPELFYRDWSLGLTFACTRHARLLADHCVKCHPLTAVPSTTPDCDCSLSQSNEYEATGPHLSAHIRHTQDRFTRLLHESIESQSALATLMSARDWLRLLVLAGDSTWPDEHDPQVRGLRAHMVDGGINRTGREETARGVDLRQREARTALATAAYGDAALRVASLETCDQQDVFDHAVDRLRVRNQQPNTTRMRRNLRLPSGRPTSAPHEEVVRDIRDAAHTITSSLEDAGLGADFVSGLLPPPGEHGLNRALDCIAGRLLAREVVTQLGQMSRPRATKVLRLPHHYAGWTRARGTAGKTYSEIAPLVADILIREPRNYRELRQTFGDEVNLSLEDVTIALPDLPTLEARLGRQLLPVTNSWCWWQLTGSAPTQMRGSAASTKFHEHVMFLNDVLSDCRDRKSLKQLAVKAGTSPHRFTA